MTTRTRYPDPSAIARGDIQKGRHRDKVPGFDPAAAPMETDSEAGLPGQAEPVEVPLETGTVQDAPSANESSYGSAMRPFDEADEEVLAEQNSSRPALRSVWLVLAIAAILALAILAW